MVYIYLHINSIIIQITNFSVSSAISLNASVFASVCLASRLSSALDAFVMVALAVQLFAFFPEFRGQLRVSDILRCDCGPICYPLVTSSNYISSLHSVDGCLLHTHDRHGNLHWSHLLLDVCCVSLLPLSILALSTTAHEKVSCSLSSYIYFYFYLL